MILGAFVVDDLLLLLNWDEWLWEHLFLGFICRHCFALQDLKFVFWSK
jgi:hypothetical protein